jgi:Glycosyl transferase family 11
MKLIVRQLSGLGNQLFQYAAGRYYTRQLKGAEVSLAYDPPHKALSHGHPRPFLLSHLAIEAPCRELTSAERRMLFLNAHLTNSRRLKPLRPIVAAALQRSLRIQLLTETREQLYRFQAALPFDERSNTIYLLGYWQVHQIADATSTDLRREFSFREPPAAKNLEMYRRIKNTENSVAVHIRRADYTLAVEGNVALPMTYYSSAIAQLTQSLQNPAFFIFSDDIDFARQNVRADLSAVFVDHNDSSAAHEDLRLMSACRHHIIANSSFSWWGAWLGSAADKIVIAPRNWMVGRRPCYDDLFPSAWRLLD